MDFVTERALEGVPRPRVVHLEKPWNYSLVPRVAKIDPQGRYFWRRVLQAIVEALSMFESRPTHLEISPSRRLNQSGRGRSVPRSIGKLTVKMSKIRRYVTPLEDLRVPALSGPY